MSKDLLLRRGQSLPQAGPIRLAGSESTGIIKWKLSAESRVSDRIGMCASPSAITCGAPDLAWCNKSPAARPRRRRWHRPCPRIDWPPWRPSTLQLIRDQQFLARTDRVRIPQHTTISVEYLHVLVRITIEVLTDLDKSISSFDNIATLILAPAH